MAQRQNPYGSGGWQSGGHPGGGFGYGYPPGGGGFGYGNPPGGYGYGYPPGGYGYGYPPGGYEGPLDRMARMVISVMECMGAMYGYGMRPPSYPWPRTQPYPPGPQGGPPQEAPSLKPVTQISTTRAAKATVTLYTIQGLENLRIVRTPVQLLGKDKTKPLTAYVTVQSCVATLEAEIKSELAADTYVADICDSYGTKVGHVEITVNGTTTASAEVRA